MIVDVRRLPVSGPIDVDICIVGGGVAGITLAREFGRAGLQACVIEGGGHTASWASQSLYCGENTGLPYDLVGTRSRFLGGSSNCWGGWCRPMAAIDFEHRPWVADSGWPFPVEALDDAYARARDVLQLGQLPYDPDFWISRLQPDLAQALPLASDAIETVIAQFSPPTRLGIVYREELEQAASIRVLLHANAVAVATDEFGQRATGVRVLRPDGSPVFVQARQVILAAGGIENARLLLLSRDRQPAGLGNGHGLVGRYFMEHPRIHMGRAVLRDPYRLHLFQDVVHSYHNPRLAIGGTSASAYFGLSDQAQRAEGLLQCRTYLIPSYPEDDLRAVNYARRIRAALYHWSGAAAPGTIRAALARIPTQARALLRQGRLLSSTPSHFGFHSVLEPAPDAESRVTLADTRDRFGCPQARVHWRVGTLEYRTHLRMLGALKQAIETAGVGTVEFDDAMPEDKWREGLAWCWHHMGTTRMHPNPRQGVVDADGRVHGMHNLYIAGSSVFPTGGHDMPTLTIAALALRLADHVKARATQAPVIVDRAA